MTKLDVVTRHDVEDLLTTLIQLQHSFQPVLVRGPDPDEVVGRRVLTHPVVASAVAVVFVVPAATTKTTGPPIGMALPRQFDKSPPNVVEIRHGPAGCTWHSSV